MQFMSLMEMFMSSSDVLYRERNRPGRRRAAGTKTAPRRRTQAERSHETQTRILKAAAQLISKKGYARFRTADVAKAAGISRGTQLHHYPTKDLLVVATLR